MAEWEGKSKGTPLGYKIFIFIIKKFGIGAAYLLLYPVVAYYYLFSKTSNKALAELKQKLKDFSSPKLPSKFKSYYNMGQAIIDKNCRYFRAHQFL